VFALLKGSGSIFPRGKQVDAQATELIGHRGRNVHIEVKRRHAALLLRRSARRRRVGSPGFSLFFVK